MYKTKIDEVKNNAKVKANKCYALIIACLFTIVFSAFWQSLEYIMTGSITPRRIDDIIIIPIAVSFYFNAKTIVAKYFK